MGLQRTAIGCEKHAFENATQVTVQDQAVRGERDPRHGFAFFHYGIGGFLGHAAICG